MMTEQQILQSKLLSPETQEALKEQIQEIEQEICNTTFPGDPTDLQSTIYQITYLQGRRSVLQNLLADCQETFSQLSNLE